MDVAILGGSGFAGAELLRLCAGRPDLRVRVVTARSHAGERVADLYPSLAGSGAAMVFAPTSPEAVDGVDVAFLCLPHGESQKFVPELVGRVGVVVDLAADFRLNQASTYVQWYGHQHRCPEFLGTFVYGLPELGREALIGATRIAAPGCYPTAAALALAPFVRAGVVEPTGIVVDAASGVSGAGRGLALATQFTTVDENFTAYGLLTHRHTSEIEQVVGAQVLFTPHLAPMNRGILATCYARPVPGSGLTTEGALAILEQSYGAEPFVVVRTSPPSTKATAGSNAAHLTAQFDERTGWLVVLCAIDNLVKGASGQAMQAANVATGVAETTGLTSCGLYP